MKNLPNILTILRIILIPIIILLIVLDTNNTNFLALAGFYHCFIIRLFRWILWLENIILLVILELC
jgi:phosphatidylglycerophosphate synthase